MLQKKGTRVLNEHTILDRCIRLCSTRKSTLLLDSKALRSESDIFATSTRGSCGVDPGPLPLRIVTPTSSMGVWLHGVRKRVVFSRSLMFSTFAKLHFRAFTVRGGGTDLVFMRARKGLQASRGVFEGIAPSSTYIR